jgi:type I restriction enzyme S subunit
MSNEPSSDLGGVLDLEQRHLRIVRDILRRHLVGAEVRAFGSRASGSAKPFSDLDLLVTASAPLTPRLCALLADDFSESDLPFKVDLLDSSSLEPNFRDRILRGSVVVHTPAA